MTIAVDEAEHSAPFVEGYVIVTVHKEELDPILILCWVIPNGVRQSAQEFERQSAVRISVLKDKILHANIIT
jgi:hypothetical protein